MVVIPADVLHGFRALTSTEMEVVSEMDAGQVLPVRQPGGASRLVEVYRPDLPWSRRPPVGFDWTSDEEMADLVQRGDQPF